MDKILSFPDSAGKETATAKAKLEAAYQIPGLVVEFDPIEAQLAGAFAEDALGESDAIDSRLGEGE